MVCRELFPVSYTHLDVYKRQALVNEFIVLIKETSIIGYIGMMDLTKGAMLIQSRTYNAFWPLMAAAAIYLVIVGILTWGMNKLERRLRTSER